ncbi:hypothetical protein F2Q69_00014969 [Brassica cretica]|uniref:Exocyst complex component EXOC6/Sec15 N-terminal domain-containing protein n=1 Tax=Brassica cretica TaxID=69181 RepID=A0A8S9R2D5_BRACR|nr:hypothetical protein F2Q69_00014969 [Brassica cretica]
MWVLLLAMLLRWGGLNVNNVARKKEAEIEDLCKTHYEELIVAVDELRGVQVDAEELKSDLASDRFPQFTCFCPNL